MPEAGPSGLELPHRPRALLWDMDGTLLDSERHWDVALRDLARYLGGSLSDSIRAQMVGASTAMSIGLLFTDLGLRPDPRASAEAHSWLLERTGELFDEGLTWRPGAEAALDLVGAAGLPMALVTNTSRALTERALGTLGRERFTASVCGDEVQRGKPEPEPYLRAAELLGVAVGHCLTIEDSPTGASAAGAAGCPVLVVPCEVTVPERSGRVFRRSLEGLTLAELTGAWHAGTTAMGQ
jgi:HAD superfamily hydrolase (TIGR01509 family)